MAESTKPRRGVIMVALFDSPLFWIGAIITLLGTIIAPILAPYRLHAVLAAILWFFSSGILLVGSALMALSSSEQRVVVPFTVTIIAWSVLVASILIALLKPKAPPFKREGPSATKTT